MGLFRFSYIFFSSAALFIEVDYLIPVSAFGFPIPNVDQK